MSRSVVRVTQAVAAAAVACASPAACTRSVHGRPATEASVTATAQAHVPDLAARIRRYLNQCSDFRCEGSTAPPAARVLCEQLTPASVRGLHMVASVRGTGSILVNKNGKLVEEANATPGVSCEWATRMPARTCRRVSATEAIRKPASRHILLVAAMTAASMLRAVDTSFR
jgi:hypothetical protein